MRQLNVTMRAAGLRRLAHGPTTCMSYQFTETSQAWGGDPQQPEHHPLAQTKHDAFVTSAYYPEWQSKAHADGVIFVMILFSCCAYPPIYECIVEFNKTPITIKNVPLIWDNKNAIDDKALRNICRKIWSVLISHSKIGFKFKFINYMRLRTRQYDTEAVDQIYRRYLVFN